MNDLLKTAQENSKNAVKTRKDYAETVFNVGVLTEFSAYFGTLIWPIMAVGELINLNSEATASEKRVGELLDEEEEIKDAPPTISKNIEGKIEYKHLSFAYPNTNYQVLNEFLELQFQFHFNSTAQSIIYFSLSNKSFNFFGSWITRIFSFWYIFISNKTIFLIITPSLSLRDRLGRSNPADY